MAGRAKHPLMALLVGQGSMLNVGVMKSCPSHSLIGNRSPEGSGSSPTQQTSNDHQQLLFWLMFFQELEIAARDISKSLWRCAYTQPAYTSCFLPSLQLLIVPRWPRTASNLLLGYRPNSVQIETHVHRQHRHPTPLLVWFPITLEHQQRSFVHQQADAWRLYPVGGAHCLFHRQDWISWRPIHCNIPHHGQKQKTRSTIHFGFLLFELRGNQTSWLPISERRPPELPSSPLRRPCTTQATCRPLTTLKRHYPLYTQLVSWLFPQFSPNHSGHVRDWHNIVGRNCFLHAERGPPLISTNLSITFSAKRQVDAHGGLSDHLVLQKESWCPSSSARETVRRGVDCVPRTPSHDDTFPRETTHLACFVLYSCLESVACALSTVELPEKRVLFGSGIVLPPMIDSSVRHEAGQGRTDMFCQLRCEWTVCCSWC